MGKREGREEEIKAKGKEKRVPKGGGEGGREEDTVEGEEEKEANRDWPNKQHKQE